MNPFDELSVEESVRIREKKSAPGGVEDICVVTAGPPKGVRMVALLAFFSRSFIFFRNCLASFSSVKDSPAKQFSSSNSCVKPLVSSRVKQTVPHPTTWRDLLLAVLIPNKTVFKEWK